MVKVAVMDCVFLLGRRQSGMVLKRNFGTGFVDGSLVRVIHCYAEFVLNVNVLSSVAEVKKLERSWHGFQLAFR